MSSTAALKPSLRALMHNLEELTTFVASHAETTKVEAQNIGAMRQLKYLLPEMRDAGKDIVQDFFAKGAELVPDSGKRAQWETECPAPILQSIFKFV